MDVLVTIAYILFYIVAGFFAFCFILGSSAFVLGALGVPNPFEKYRIKPMMLGALPPVGVEWTVGATAASIAFVNQSETYIAKNQLSEVRLRPYMNRVKNKEVILTDWLTPEEFLAGKKVCGKDSTYYKLSEKNCSRTMDMLHQGKIYVDITEAGEIVGVEIVGPILS